MKNYIIHKLKIQRYLTLCYDIPKALKGALSFCLLGMSHLKKQDLGFRSFIHWFFSSVFWVRIQWRLKEIGRYFDMKAIWIHKGMSLVSSLTCNAKKCISQNQMKQAINLTVSVLIALLIQKAENSYGALLAPIRNPEAWG